MYTTTVPSTDSPAATRRAFTAGALIVPRAVLGGPGYVPPSDRINLAVIGPGRQGIYVMMQSLLPRPDVQVVAVCDCNEGSRNYFEYGANSLLTTARRLLGAGYENWGEDLASPGFAQVTKEFRTSLGMGGREPAKRVVDAYYASRKRSGAGDGCAGFRDYRELLAKQKDLNAVYVATPDHWHAPVSLAAMRAGKHVLCQKPMTHSIAEARRMAAAARDSKVATSLTVNNPSSEATRTIAAWLADGAIGSVREVHNWSRRPLWPQGVERPLETPPVPPGLDWDLWLGPAPGRPYHPLYQPFNWRGWYDFGCGAFGDMGCYSFAGLFETLKLTPPAAVEASTSEVHDETYPKASIVHLDFPANGAREPLRLTWYDGGLRPPRPSWVSGKDTKLFRHRAEGVLYVGSKGFLLGGFSGEDPRVYPASRKYEMPAAPAREEDRAIGQWLAACQGGPTPKANFESQAPVTEALLLGCLAQRMPGERLEWSSETQRVTNDAKANALVDPPYRAGFVS